jgi:hypothetical protein
MCVWPAQYSICLIRDVARATRLWPYCLTCRGRVFLHAFLLECCWLFTYFTCCCLADVLVLHNGPDRSPVWQQLQQLCRGSVACLAAMLEQQTAAVQGEHSVVICADWQHAWLPSPKLGRL